MNTDKIAVDTTVGIWFRQQAWLVLVDQGALASAAPDASLLPQWGVRLAVVRHPNSGGVTANVDEALTILAPWPPFHPQHVPMMLPCSEGGQEVRVYRADPEAPESFDPAGVSFVCDPAIAIEDAEHWWVLSWSEQVSDAALIERPFDLAVLVERSDLSGSTTDVATSRTIAAARAKAPRMRCSGVYVISPMSGERLGPAQIVSYIPGLSKLRITFQLELTRSGSIQPKATIEAVEGADLGDVLANLCVFQLHRAGPSLGLPDLSFDRLGRDAHRIRQRRVSTGFFPPVRNGDLIGILARGIDLQPEPGIETTQIPLSLWAQPTGFHVQMMVRQEDGFTSVNDDLELVQSGRLGGVATTVARACPLLDEERLVCRLMDWIRRRIEQVARNTVARLDGSSLRSRADLALRDRHGQLGYLMYTAASADELRVRVESDKPLDDPWLTVRGVPDRESLVAHFASIARSGLSDHPSREG